LLFIKFLKIRVKNTKATTGVLKSP